MWHQSPLDVFRMQMLPKALAGTMKEQIRTGWTLQSLAKAADGTFELTYR